MAHFMVLLQEGDTDLANNQEIGPVYGVYHNRRLLYAAEELDAVMDWLDEYARPGDIVDWQEGIGVG